ncbi:hypothetical protein quinque_003070 [Culex quinquefasciatus]
MVRNYKRISVRKSWSREALTAAIEAVQAGSTVNRAALSHGVPRPTPGKYLLLVGPPDENRNLGRFKPVFTAQQERELVDYILAMEVTLYGVTSLEMRSLAYQLATINRIDHPFDNGTELAGKDWLYGFRMRHLELSLRAPEATSAARAQGFNKVAVDQFYDIVEAALSTGKFRKPSQFKNVDETCVVTVQSKRSKILALKGRRQVGAITSAERGVLSTACISSSACGQYLPPIHKLQPLDVSFMGPLKTNFSQVIERYFKANPGKAVTINDVSELLGDAYLRSATPKNAIVGFDKTGLWPFNRHNFKLEDFAAAKATDVLDNFETDQEKPLCPPPAPVEPTPGQHPVPAEPSSKQSLLSPVDPISGQPPVPDEPSVGQRPDLAESTSKQTLLSPVEPISGQPPVPVEPTSGQSLLSPGELTPGRQGFTVSPEATSRFQKWLGGKLPADGVVKGYRTYLRHLPERQHQHHQQQPRVFFPLEINVPDVINGILSSFRFIWGRFQSIFGLGSSTEIVGAKDPPAPLTPSPALQAVPLAPDDEEYKSPVKTVSVEVDDPVRHPAMHRKTKIKNRKRTPTTKKKRKKIDLSAQWEMIAMDEGWF